MEQMPKTSEMTIVKDISKVFFFKTMSFFHFPFIICFMNMIWESQLFAALHFTET